MQHDGPYWWDEIDTYDVPTCRRSRPNDPLYYDFASKRVLIFNEPEKNLSPAVKSPQNIAGAITPANDYLIHHHTWCHFFNCRYNHVLGWNDRKVSNWGWNGVKWWNVTFHEECHERAMTMYGKIPRTA